MNWSGAIPQVEKFKAFTLLTNGEIIRENPNAPTVDLKSRGVKNAVVFLRGIDSRRSRPWDHPKICVEQRDLRIQIHQGDSVGRVGFVRRHDSIEIVARDADYHSLQARGAAFFSFSFPDKDQPRHQRLKENGMVELSSAAGFYWMRAYLFVDDHPYYALTDDQGRFILNQVPAGDYDLVCWHPNWTKAGHERDTESGLIRRLSFQKPAEIGKKISVNKNQPVTADFELSLRDFK